MKKDAEVLRYMRERCKGTNQKLGDQEQDFLHTLGFSTAQNELP